MSLPKRVSRWYCSIPITGLAQASTHPKQFIRLNLYPPRAQQPSQQELIDRLMFIQANESAKCYQENVVRSVADANISAIVGVLRRITVVRSNLSMPWG
ncbi:hypothetical protein [uncultured Psychrobacter sp.]|uniref:hypothetical protein n=1 Tax=uncultured Psychrobacter sp. TaxID=259303 RepID=UPI00259589CF|nr:hypothetical protein [uncultured Psychrobacter sp.]